MKKILSATLSIAVAFSLLVTIGCSSDSNPLTSSNSPSIDNQLSAFIGDNTSQTDDNAALFHEADPMGLDFSLFGDDATCNGNGEDNRGKGGNRGRGGHHGRVGHHDGGDHPQFRTKFDSLRLVLSCLELTADQNVAVQQVLNDLHTQVSEIMKATRTAQEPIRADAKAQAKVVLYPLGMGLQYFEFVSQVGIATCKNTVLQTDS